ncbi:MAG TPA: hypothetical protein DCR40_21890 [Prolixibacteraceae bacterium]|nr:hypothetical protein [Prolixibacteraceae bacterium]
MSLEIMSRLKQSILFLILTGLFACTHPEPKIQLQSGDLLFREKSSENISEAIDQVTLTSGETHFSHVGLVEVTDTGVVVLHAYPEGGISMITLKEFIYPKGDSVTVIAYRLKEEWQKGIPSAMQKAHQMLGKPYNFSYITSDTAHYCSEFIYLAFAAGPVFELEPMTFKDPATGNFPAAWVEYYQKMGVEIPEGLPGCNPNGLAASNKLKKLGKITL